MPETKGEKEENLRRSKDARGEPRQDQPRADGAGL